MQLGLIGLGKMGGNMATRLRGAGHEVIGYDRDPRLSDAPDLAGLVARLSAPRVIWVMVPAGDATRSTVAALAELLSTGDIVIDGGNSRFTDDTAHAEQLSTQGVGYLDVGVSGGVWGPEFGYALMVGGDPGHVAQCQPIFDALKPADDFGFVHAGPVGAGHYAKMVHNGIEYGLMQSYAEGYDLLMSSEFIADVPGVIKSWRSGTVIRSWLLDLLDRALDDDPELAKIAGYAADSGEGRWTVEEAIRLGVPLEAITSSLFARFGSRREESTAMKALAAFIP